MGDPLSIVNHVESAKLYGASLIGTSVHQSLPVPVLEEGAVRIGFLYCHAEIREPNGPLCLWPPRYLGLLDPQEGKLERIRAVRPSDFQRSDAEDKPMGGCATPGQRMSEAYLTAQARFYQAFDATLPHFRAAADTSVPEVRASVDEFRKWFLELREEPLIPYYDLLGRAFFRWLG